MLIYTNTVYETITAWIRTLSQSSKKKSILCLVNGGIDSCLNAALALKSTSHMHTDLIFMGFKPAQEESFQKWVTNSFPVEHYQIIKPQHPTLSDNELSNVDIRSSISATYVDMYAKLHSAITFGSVTKSEYSMVKFFKSRIDEVYDYYPIIDLYRSEVIQLAEYINLPSDIVRSKSLTEESFGYTYEELEWLDRENESLSIVSASNMPNLAPHWGLFNDRKKQLLMKVYQMEKENRNKSIPDGKKCLIRKLMPGSIS